MSLIVRVTLCDRDGRETSAVRRGDRWICPRDEGDLGDASGYRAVRIGSRCLRCGLIVCAISLRDGGTEPGQPGGC